MHRLRLILFSALFALALAPSGAAMSDTGPDDAADTGGIGGVNIGDAKDKAIDDRLSCAGTEAQATMTWGLVVLGLFFVRRRTQTLPAQT